MKYLDAIDRCPFRKKCQNYCMSCDDVYSQCRIYREYIKEEMKQLLIDTQWKYE